MTGKIENLPKWAQIEISRLKANLQSLERQIDIMIGDNPTTRDTVVLRNFSVEGYIDKPLPDGDIHFPAHNISVSTDASGRLVVRAVRGEIRILPSSSNVVYAESHSSFS